MKGTITTPKFYLKCIHCGREELIDIDYEADIPTELLPWAQDGKFECEDKVVKEGDTVPSICPKCVELGLSYPSDWEELEEEV